MEHLRPALRACLGGESSAQELVLDAINCRGKPIRCDVTCAPLLAPADDVRGAILLMVESGDGRGDGASQPS